MRYSQIAYQTEQLFLKKFFDKMISIQSDKMTDLWLNDSLTFTLYMAGFSQSQHFFAAGCLFADFAIVFFCTLLGCCHTQILILSAKINFANMLKIFWNSSKLRDWPNF